MLTLKKSIYIKAQAFKKATKAALGINCSCKILFSLQKNIKQWIKNKEYLAL